MTFPTSGRFAPLTIKQHFNQAKVDNQGKPVVALLTLVSDGKDKGLKFGALIAIHVEGAKVAEYTVVSDTSGARASYTTADLGIKMMAGIIPSNTGEYDVKVAVGTVLDVAPASDLVKAAQSRKAKLVAQKTKVQAKMAEHDAQLALMVGWESGNALQANRKAEVQAQKQALADLVASIDAEVAVLTAQGA